MLFKEDRNTGKQLRKYFFMLIDIKDIWHGISFVVFLPKDQETFKDSSQVLCKFGIALLFLVAALIIHGFIFPFINLRRLLRHEA